MSTERGAYRGRFAPSPTGRLHFGSLVAAVGSWLHARSRGGTWLVRIEDIDPPREVPGASAAILEALAAFGMTPDEPVWFQHARHDAYAAALQQLIEAGLAFPCACTRAEVRERGVHRGRCPAPLAGKPFAWRMQVPDRVIGFVDAVQGTFRQNLHEATGDFVLRRADGLWAYQLAVVVDDAAQGITDVVRGADLLDSTPRQMLLHEALDLPTPAYAHLPLLLDADGNKLAKQNGAAPLDTTDPMPSLRHALAVLGQDEAASRAAATPESLLAQAIADFDAARIPRQMSLRSATWHSLAVG
jgi:glutamyl-Q tRNA(Asp) synthetase